MAQGQLASVPPLANGASLGLSRDELHHIQQYERIVQFRDAILAGSHSKIKVPAQLAGQTPAHATASSSESSTSAKETNGNPSQGYQVGNLQSFATNTQQASLPGLGNPPPANANLPARPFVGSGKTEINPIFLQKSDDLIKAEIQLQRQRLERLLRDEVDQRRASMKASAQSEPLADFDLSDVLSKALTLVQAAAPSSVNATLAAANISAASDSVDENSYYSSQINSPDSSLRSSRGGNDAEVTAQIPKPSTAGQPSEGQAQVQANQKAQAGLQSSLSYASVTHQPQGQASNSIPSQSRPVPSRSDAAPAFSRYPSVGTTRRMDRGDNTGVSTSGGGSGNTSRSEESGVMDLDGSADRSVPAVGQQLLRESMLARQPSPLIQVRAHNISPLAPQPSHVSPLAMARGPAADAQDMIIPQGTTAQVAALRNEPNVISSPDSSPQGGRSGEKRKGKKKKNNANGKRAARQAPDEPYIKPEPRSPSPMNAPSFIRPQKRQRRQDDEEPRYAQPERQFSRSYREEGAMPMYETQEYRPRPASHAAATGDYGYGREYVDEPRVLSGAEYVRHVASPGVYAVHAAPSEVYATSPASVDRYGREPARYYRDGYEVTRMSARPMTDRARSRSPIMRERASPLMGPPKAPPGRVVVDPATGRRYYEPQTVVRQSVAPPPMRPGESEIIYERAPIRAESRRPGPNPRDDDVLYQRTSPVYAAPRRVVTQPDYVSDPQRIYRQREYSTRPVAPPGEEFIAARGGIEQRRIIEEAPREYMMRATTARPAETVRYELPRDYGRVQSVRPEQIPIQDYASAPMHPDARREMIQPGPRSYSVRPAEPQVVRREYSARPVEQQPYYGQPVPARGEPEVSYIERPRVATHEMYYADEPPRPVYR
ncbi:hypothetical protein CORC01_05871 [Colletotrichum orchidophilum]|uniref:Uncharacterized protein n=1 Tax=Colletotrichum orchidophilum TaxID=1209926 RepID=A0A1G4BBU6_9PEZI|nr:uncharacterized protein CORC01_05871 [Colletotrichum orchidophilum]OHE98782.1 hypothetical protein CORC01_05871 [Colletotrichum orchidophilum]